MKIMWFNLLANLPINSQLCILVSVYKSVAFESLSGGEGHLVAPLGYHAGINPHPRQQSNSTRGRGEGLLQANAQLIRGRNFIGAQSVHRCSMEVTVQRLLAAGEVWEQAEGYGGSGGT